MLCDQCGNCEYFVEKDTDEGMCNNEFSSYFEEIVGFDDDICSAYEEKEC